MSNVDNMSIDEAMRLLSLTDTFTLNDLNMAYRQHVMANHPDRAKNDADKTRRMQRMTMINQARMLLISYANDGSITSAQATNVTTKVADVANYDMTGTSSINDNADDVVGIDMSFLRHRPSEFPFDADCGDEKQYKEYVNMMRNIYWRYIHYHDNRKLLDLPEPERKFYEQYGMSDAYRCNKPYEYYDDHGNPLCYNTYMLKQADFSKIPKTQEEYINEALRTCERLPDDIRQEAIRRASIAPYGELYNNKNKRQLLYYTYITGYGFAERHDGLTAMDRVRMYWYYQPLRDYRFTLDEMMVYSSDNEIFIDDNTGLPFYGTAVFKDGYHPHEDDCGPFDSKRLLYSGEKFAFLSKENGGTKDMNEFAHQNEKAERKKKHRFSFFGH